MGLTLGSPLYMAPEVIKNEKYSSKVDVWALGVLTYIMLSNKMPFEGSNVEKVHQSILSHTLLCF